MAEIIKKLNEDMIENIYDCIDQIKKGFPKLSTSSLHLGEQYLYHYTSFEKLFSVLDGDGFWASRSRFSNDSTEDQILGKDWIKQEQYYGDNYILCFCEEDDILSQWRGYCPKGGVSIGFRFPQGFQTYTLLHSDYDEKAPSLGKHIETYKNRPIPVVYCKPENSSTTGIETGDLLKLFDEPEIKKTDVFVSDIVPYLKNSYFQEEREFRLVFNNSNGELEKCVRFRKLEDGSMIPYISIKYGDILEMGKRLSLTYTESKINNIIDERIKDRHRRPIIIPCGREQATVCNSFITKIRDYKKKLFRDETRYVEQIRWMKNPLQVICDGHLPIVSITVSPSPQQEHMKEVIERFCQSKYWLQNVEVKCSQIPYIAPKL